MKLLHVVGARPNFPKLAPVYRAGQAAGLQQVVVHTGQHYDDALSGAFLRDLGIGEPDINLEVGSLSHASQTAQIMQRIEPVLLAERPDWLVVYGDVNSTVGAALVAAKLGILIAHVEAGLRSYDRTMPEEINRLVTDRLANLLLTPSRDADATLRAEGEPDHEIAFVGNVMIDSLCRLLEKARASGFRQSLGLEREEAVVVTLHRPSNVDDPERLAAIATALRAIAEERAVLFTVHPRTAERLKAGSISLGGVRVVPPIRYHEMLDLVDSASVVITDSGGLQEETTALGVPCLTVRENTERPITVVQGTNTLVPDPKDLLAAVRSSRRQGGAKRPDGWDGRAGERVVRALMDFRGASAPASAASAARGD
jgi:UDP-N-acetylglucosamine 2-epimerase (non-hydrolysing)